MIPNSQKVPSDPQKQGSGHQKQGVDPQKRGSWTPKIMTTGRWMCRKCLNYVAPETRVCRCCGGESFTVEWDENALSAAHLREQEREEEREKRVNPL